MLLELRIENLLLIERAELRLGEGLNAITGETGAGKTVLAHALDLLLGGRARPGIVRPGAEEAWVEGAFALPDRLLDDPELATVAERLPAGADEVVLGRRVGSSGRTTAFVGGRAATAAELAALGSRLVAFYGQHEHRRLMLGSAQLEILDGFAGPEQLADRERYAAAHAEVARLTRELEELREGTPERDLDLLRFELDEIESIAPQPDETEELVAERERLRHAEALRAAAGTALVALAGDEGEGGSAAALAAAEAALGAGAGVDPELDEIAERVGAVAVEVGDLASSLRGYLDQAEVEPARLAEVEERLDAIERLKRKHGGSVEAVLAHAERCRERIAQLEDVAGSAAALEGQLSAAQREREEIAGRLSERRGLAAEALAERAAAELAELAMDGARLEVALEPHPDGFGATGAERVELRIATNPGLPVAPLRDAASGGELSRVMLALAGLAGLGGAEAAPTLVFDEIDAGVGGTTARAVGERLRALGETRQVICITHLPQVASQAGMHFRIAKTTRDGEAVATVDRVEGDELVAEIVRMLGGERGDRAASRHARQLLKAA